MQEANPLDQLADQLTAAHFTPQAPEAEEPATELVARAAGQAPAATGEPVVDRKTLHELYYPDMPIDDIDVKVLLDFQMSQGGQVSRAPGNMKQARELMLANLLIGFKRQNRINAGEEVEIPLQKLDGKDIKICNPYERLIATVSFDKGLSVCAFNIRHPGYAHIQVNSLESLMFLNTTRIRYGRWLVEMGLARFANEFDAPLEKTFEERLAEQQAAQVAMQKAQGVKVKKLKRA